jgi:hypothetical protein
MSTPSGKVPHLVDLAAHDARQAREAQSAEPDQPPASGNESPPPSPYAPKPPDVRAAARLRVLAKDDADDVLSAYAPKRAHTPATGTVTNSETPPSAVKRLKEPPTAAPPQDVAEPRKQRIGETQHRIIVDREIGRIEDILRQLKRRELAAPRLPRGPNLPAPDAACNVLGRRTEMLDTFGGQRSLGPARLPPPPLQPMHNLRATLGISIACVGAALACYYFLSPPSAQPTRQSQVASLPPVSPVAISTPQTASSRGPRLDSEPDWTPRTSGVRTEVIEARKAPEGDTAPETLVSLQRPANAKLEFPGEQPQSPSTAVRALQPEEIRLLVQQGEKFITDGDIVTARVIFERAAKAGDAAAALALAAAYDPIVLARLGVLGIDTDVEKARIWYQKAQSLGSAQAADRLDALARR